MVVSVDDMGSIQPASILLKTKFGIDVTAVASSCPSTVLGQSWAGEMPADVLSACIALRGSEDWRVKAETQFDNGKFAHAAESYEMAVKTASAALLLLEGHSPDSQAASYLRATQEHILECLASRGAAHFRQRLYDRCGFEQLHDSSCLLDVINHRIDHSMRCDLEAAHALEAALQRRPDIQKRLQHLQSPGNVRPYVMRMDGRGPLPPLPPDMRGQVQAAFEGAERGFFANDYSDEEDREDNVISPVAHSQQAHKVASGSRMGGELRRRKDAVLKTSLAEALEAKPRRGRKAGGMPAGPWVVPVAATSVLALAAVVFLWY